MAAPGSDVSFLTAYGRSWWPGYKKPWWSSLCFWQSAITPVKDIRSDCQESSAGWMPRTYEKDLTCRPRPVDGCGSSRDRGLDRCQASPQSDCRRNRHLFVGPDSQSVSCAASALARIWACLKGGVGIESRAARDVRKLQRRFRLRLVERSRRFRPIQEGDSSQILIADRAAAGSRTPWSFEKAGFATVQSASGGSRGRI